MARDTDIARREERGLTRPDPYGSPVRVLERFADEMDKVFGDFGLGRGWMAPRQAGSWLGAPAAQAAASWAPEVEVFHRNSELVVRADLPGLRKDEIKVDVTEDRVTIQGERKREREETQEGVYRSERSYGTFCRDILLPPGTISDQAKASFHDGVLEITMPAPPESARRGRRLEIAEAPVASKTTGVKK
jgi:HSP20 family protein